MKCKKMVKEVVMACFNVKVKVKVKVRLFLFVTVPHGMKMYGEVEI